MLAVNTLVRSSFHYSMGIRGFFLAAPLVSWLFGSWLLLGTTVFYVVGILMMESDFLISDEIWEREEDPPLLPNSSSGGSIKEQQQPEQVEEARAGSRTTSVTIVSPPSSSKVR